MKYLVIGGVAGGATVAARLRRLEEKAEIILFERGEYVSYANCGLPYYIGDVIKDRDKLFVQTVQGFVNRFAIDIRPQQEVLAIEPEQKRVLIQNLRTKETYYETYDKLVLSPGAEPLRPNIEGIQQSNIFTLRNVPDTDKIKQYTLDKKPRRAVVVGGGFIGLEMAENLHELGIEVCVIEMANQVMAPLDYSMAANVHRHLKDKGIGLILGDGVDRFEPLSQTTTRIHLKSGKTIDTDLTILSIGVRPETKLAREAGLKIGVTGGIEVNSHLQTSDSDIYALGDAIEVESPITGRKVIIPLAGPANKQGRIVANNIVLGNKYKYDGTIGTSIAKIFDLTVAATGVAAKVLIRENIPYVSSHTHSASHAGYYPGAVQMQIKIIFSPEDGRLYGAQIVGYSGVDKRIEMIAGVIKNKGSIYDLMELEQAYAPPFSSAKDPVNMAGFVADNILSGKVKVIQWNQVNAAKKQGALLLDVRTKEEFELGHIEGAINIPVDNLRNSLQTLNPKQDIIVYCAIGLRGYLAYRILEQNGFTAIRNLSGGYKTYSVASGEQSNPIEFSETLINSNDEITDYKPEILQVDACGLQCPGPIVKLKKHYSEVNNGEHIRISATDPGFAKDVASWCNITGARLVEVKNNNGVINATIEKQENKSCKMLSNGDNKTLIVFSDDLDKALASFVIANGAAATGKKVTMFFTFWGLNVIKKQNAPKVHKDIFGQMFGMMLPKSSLKLKLSKMNMGGIGSKMMRYIMKDKKIDSLESLITQAAESGVEMIACTMSMDVMGVKKEELFDNVTLGGVATYLERAEDANVNLFI
ncbi:MAG: DsrE/DsrF/DrsH-like family protein [Tannerellaceae bacterium]